jgi:hypothetical protein
MGDVTCVPVDTSTSIPASQNPYPDAPYWVTAQEFEEFSQLRRRSFDLQHGTETKKSGCF